MWNIHVKWNYDCCYSIGLLGWLRSACKSAMHACTVAHMYTKHKITSIICQCQLTMHWSVYSHTCKHMQTHWLFSISWGWWCRDTSEHIKWRVWFSRRWSGGRLWWHIWWRKGLYIPATNKESRVIQQYYYKDNSHSYVTSCSYK